jgi:hypothetical protein
MIKLPPGCTVAYGITIDVDQLTPNMVEWYEMIGGTVAEKTHYNHRGSPIVSKYVQYNSKPCHYLLDGTNSVRLHFLGTDASTARVFLIKFNEHVKQHNLKRMEENVY